MAVENMGWNVDTEVSLFHAMRHHKPVGINRHFQMVFIQEKLSSCISKKITAKQIWQHLSTLYDLNALNESEMETFVNKQQDFQLPDSDFSDMMAQDFPRVPASTEAGSTKDHKDSPSSKESKETASSSSSSGGKKERLSSLPSSDRLDKEKERAERLTDSAKAEDSPKREQRKRTRNSLPGTPTEQNPTPKRARRI